MNKEDYLQIVAITLESMLRLKDEQKDYNFDRDVEHYLNSTIKPDGILSPYEFSTILQCAKEVHGK